MLSQQEFDYYIEKAQKGDDNAKTVIFKNNEPLLKSIIKKFQGKGVEYDDLYQIASLALVKAIQNYDKSFNVKFSTYTVAMVAGEIKRFIRDNGSIKVSRNLKILANKISRYEDDFLTQNNRSPSVEELSKHFGVPEETVVLALDASKMPLSLFEKSDEDGESMLIDKIPCGNLEDEIIEKLEINSFLNSLTEREKKIIILRYYRDKTQNEIAEALGVSQVQVSRLENKILDKLRLKF